MMGNNKAYKNFLSEAKPGTHIHIDVNDLRHVNHEMGHETGTQALLAVGKAIKHAMDESVGEKHQLFRHGGDKFMAHVPNQEHAAIFARNLSQKLSSIPALRGSHQLSVSIGYGNNPDFAREALKTAKGHKILAGKEKGKADTHVHAYVPASTPIPSM
jgi:GGDEF domain-containing protein